MQKTSTAELPAFFERFQTEEHVLRVNKIQSSDENALMEIILRLKIAMNLVATKKTCFWCFCRFATRALTLRPQKTYIDHGRRKD